MRQAGAAQVEAPCNASVPYILDAQQLVVTAFPEDEQLVIQKAFFDHLWEFYLSTMVGTIGSVWTRASPFGEIPTGRTEITRCMRSQ